MRQTTLDRFLKENKNIRKVIPTNRCSIPGKHTSYYLLQRVQTGSEAYPDSFSVGNGTAFPGIKRPARGTDKTANPVLRFRMNGAVSPAPHMAP